MDNQELVRLFWNRDETAIAEAIKEYGSYCFTVANNILNDQQDAEECVNDTWIRIWNNIPPQSPHNFGAFAAKITRNLSIDRLKHRSAAKRYGQNLALAELENSLSTDGNLSENLQLEELKKSINQFLQQCKGRDRNVFIRRYFFLESIELIANEYGMTQENVTQILCRMRKKLKLFLTKEGYYI
ncbi:MAG: sigma-70 family RNA polymerase sigma factor [Clostridia bacterium]|nr:sigma-70 family RNA polymerase sigma factor [Clostridia bacterium]